MVTNTEALFQLGLSHHQNGRLQEAQDHYALVIQLNPKHADALHLLGVIAFQKRSYVQAAKLMHEAITCNPQFAAAHSNLGLVYAELKDYHAAVTSFQTALACAPEYAEAHANLSMAQTQLLDFEGALQSADQALSLNPQYTQAHFNRGVALQNLERFEEAAGSFRESCRLNPRFALGFLNLGECLSKLGRFEEAMESLRTALGLDPGLSFAHVQCGLVYKAQRHWDQALAAFDQSLLLNPKEAFTHFQRGLVLHKARRYQEALQSYQAACSLDPGIVECWSNWGIALLDLERPNEALECFKTAVALKPIAPELHAQCCAAHLKLSQHKEALQSGEQAVELGPLCFEAQVNLGLVFYALRQWARALQCLDRAIDIESSDQSPLAAGRLDSLASLASPTSSVSAASAHSNQGLVLQEMGRFQEALEAFSLAIKIDPQFAKAYCNRAFVHEELRQFGLALEDLLMAQRLTTGAQPLDYLPGKIHHLHMMQCDWKDHDTRVQSLVQGVLAGHKTAQSIELFSSVAEVRVHKAVAKRWLTDRYPENTSLAPLVKDNSSPAKSVTGPSKIRLAYFSADFRDHPVAYQIAELFELHEREHFEVLGFYVGPPVQDVMHQRIKAAMDAFYEVRDQSDEEVARLARSLGVDIAIDLTGPTAYCRLGIFAHRAAPLQISYLGFAGGLGAPYIDYLVGDAVVTPLSGHAAESYDDPIIRMPHSYMVNDRLRPIENKVYAREDFGLPKRMIMEEANEAVSAHDNQGSGMVFACFNNVFKITPAVFAVWCEVLKQVPGSVLWLSSTNQTAQTHLEERFAGHGLDPKRLIFAKRMDSLDQHLARIRLADLFLDTTPYNAHTTATDALWAGLPLLTCTGESFSSRVAASLLTAAGLPELITHHLSDYQTLAIELARHPRRLNALRERLASNRDTCPLFDTPRFTRDFERALVSVLERQRLRLSPQSLDVAQI